MGCSVEMWYVGSNGEYENNPCVPAMAKCIYPVIKKPNLQSTS